MTTARRRIRPGLVIGLALLAGIVLVGVLAPLWDESARTLSSQANALPSEQHLLGTDNLGRDVLSRTLNATRLSLLMTAGASLISVGGGVLVGCLIWAAPRRVRDVAIRFVDAAVAYPSLISALIIAAILGAGSASAVVAIGLANLPAFARITSNLAASVSRQNYMTTVGLLGVGKVRLMFRHLLPNVGESLLILTASNLASNLVELSSLSFVGLGVQSPEFDFGKLLSDGLSLVYTQPFAALAPSFMITLAGVSVVLIGDSLAGGFDLRSRLLGRRPSRAQRLESALTRGLADGELSVRNLTVKRRDGVVLVDDLSFDIQSGQVLGLVGESGSGKSLTAMAIADLLPENLVREARRIQLGRDDLLSKLPARVLATHIGLIYQDPGTTFNPAIRMGAQLVEVRTLHQGVPRSKARDEMVARLQDVRIDDPAARMRAHPFELSGGMLQRAMIASATVTNPRVIIADEPTTALDVTVQAEVLRLLRRINRERGTSMLFISHDIEVVGAICDSVLVMKDGRIVEQVSGDDLAAGDVTHPYTLALLASSPARLPRPDRSSKRAVSR